MPYINNKYYPDNLEFPWKKAGLSSLVGMTVTAFLPVGWLSVGLVGAGIMGANFIRNRFIRYSLETSIDGIRDNKSNGFKALQATNDVANAMEHGVRAAQSNWEYLKSFNPFSPAFRHWMAFSAGFAAKTAQDYPSMANEHLLEKLQDKLTNNQPEPLQLPEEMVIPKPLIIGKPVQIPVQPQDKYKLAIDELIKCGTAFSEDVQNIPVRARHDAFILSNYFDVAKLEITLKYPPVDGFKLKNDPQTYKTEGDVDQVMLAFQRYVNDYFGSEVAIEPKETVKKIYGLR